MRRCRRRRCFTHTASAANCPLRQRTTAQLTAVTFNNFIVAACSYALTAAAPPLLLHSHRLRRRCQLPTATARNGAGEAERRASQLRLAEAEAAAADGRHLPRQLASRRHTFFRDNMRFVDRLVALSRALAATDPKYRLAELQRWA
jgi:hypothetical protein